MIDSSSILIADTGFVEIAGKTIRPEGVAIIEPFNDILEHGDNQTRLVYPGGAVVILDAAYDTVLTLLGIR